MVSADDYKDRRKLMKELADAVLSGKCLDGNLYYVSKSWYDLQSLYCFGLCLFLFLFFGRFSLE